MEGLKITKTVSVSMPPIPCSSIIIEGEFADGVLGTFRLIRGFATLQDLASISAPFLMNAPADAVSELSGHQRTINSQHAESIKRYLQDGKPRFYPRNHPVDSSRLRNGIGQTVQAHWCYQQDTWSLDQEAREEQE
jgi:hypothetical protein